MEILKELGNARVEIVCFEKFRMFVSLYSMLLKKLSNLK